MMIERYQHTAGSVFVTGPGPCTVRSMALGAQQLIKCMGLGWKTRGLGRVFITHARDWHVAVAQDSGPTTRLLRSLYYFCATATRAELY